jgi:hypothetical protein
MACIAWLEPSFEGPRASRTQQTGLARYRQRPQFPTICEGRVPRRAGVPIEPQSLRNDRSSERLCAAANAGEPRCRTTCEVKNGFPDVEFVARFSIQFSKSRIVSRRSFTPRNAKRPSHTFISHPMEGVGNAGCLLHPQPRVHFEWIESTRVTTSTPEHPAFPAQWF